MAISAAQVLALIESHGEANDQRFYTTALQIAANEARLGHGKIAKQISTAVHKYQFNHKKNFNEVENTLKNDKDISNFVELSFPSQRFSNLFVDETVKSRLQLIIKEHRLRENLKKFDLRPKSKLLFSGPPGTGKTLTAAVLASELKLPLYKIVLESVFSKYMGNTASHLKSIFTFISHNEGVYLFDEFDSIGTDRSNPNDVGETRRILNSFLILLDQLQSESLVIAATNHPQVLDSALDRRFDDIITFNLPSLEETRNYLEFRMTKFEHELLNWDKIYTISKGLSLGDIAKAFDDAAKNAIFNNNNALKNEYLFTALNRRKKS